MEQFIIQIITASARTQKSRTNIVRIETRGKIFVSGKIITTNGKEFLIGGKVAKTLKNKLKK